MGLVMMLFAILLAIIGGLHSIWRQLKRIADALDSHPSPSAEGTGS